MSKDFLVIFRHTWLHEGFADGILFLYPVIFSEAWFHLLIKLLLFKPKIDGLAVLISYFNFVVAYYEAIHGLFTSHNSLDELEISKLFSLGIYSTCFFLGAFWSNSIFKYCLILFISKVLAKLIVY